MSLDHDDTFFDGLIPPEMNLLTGESNKVVNAPKPNGEDAKKAPRKSKAPNHVNKPTKQKENSNSEKTETKTLIRTRNTKREPLKALNNTEKAPKPGDGSTKKESEGKKNSMGSKQLTATEKKDQKKTVPKTVVFRNGPNEAKVQSNKKKPVHTLSKLCDSSDTTGRKSFPGSKKSETLNPPAKKTRASLSDLSSVTPQNKTKTLPKETEESKKSPESSRPKPPQPESKENLSRLTTVFPNVDPEFLKSQLTNFKGSVQETIEFLLSKKAENEMPTQTDYLKRQEVDEFYKENFTVEYFLTMFPNPWEHFLNTNAPKTSSYIEHSLYYLKNKYRKHYLQAIHEALAKNKNSLYLADKELSRKNRLLKMRATNRSRYECDASKPTTFDAQFMQEAAFIENEREIKLQLKKAEIARNKKFKEAEKSKTLLECLSCNNFSLLQDDAVNCPAHHVFCKDCLIKYVKVEIEKDDFRFKCLIKCEAAFSVETLQHALTPVVVARIVERNQRENIKPEGIENLASCPLCYNIFVVPAEVTVLKCVNSACMMESCRKCRKQNHAPWSCGEAKYLTKGSLEEEQEKAKSDDGKQEIGESAKNENDLFLTFDGEFIKGEVSDEASLGTVCSVCQRPGCSSCECRTRAFPSLSFSSDETEYAEIASEHDDEKNFLAFLSWNPEF